MFVELGILILSLAVLSKSSSAVVKSIEKLSNSLGVSDLAIAFVFISILTSLPELSVSVIASVNGAGTIALGNIFGSIVSNVFLVLGLVAWLYGRIEIKEDKVIKISNYLSVIALILIILDVATGAKLTSISGVLLLLMFLFYTVFIFKSQSGEKTRKLQNNGGRLKNLILFLVALAVVLVSADFVVRYVVTIAEYAKIEQGIIGATIIALGTSIPELSICLHAAKRKKYGIVLGTIMGSNIVDMTLVLGSAAIIKPISIAIAPLFGVLGFALLATLASLYFVQYKEEINKKSGLFFLVLYVIYIAAIIYL